MPRFFAKMPFWIRLLFPRYVWRLPTPEQVVYLTFDDGPHPQVTPFVLDSLKAYEAKATFFCIGKNVAEYPEVYQRILAEGHAVGNHTQNHLNGWKTDTENYIRNVAAAATLIESNLFRPPYGRISRAQAQLVPSAMRRPDARIIMWDVLSSDYDQSLPPAQCLARVLNNCRPGSIVVFHDSEKAFPNLKEVLPVVLKELSARGFKFYAIGEGV